MNDMGLSMTTFEAALVLVNSGILSVLLRVVWQASKRDSLLQCTAKSLDEHVVACGKKYEKLFEAIKENHGELQRLRGHLESESRR